MKEVCTDPEDGRELSLAKRMAALGRLSASIAHELGNPLIGITYLLDDLSNRAELSLEDKHLIGAGLKECGRMRDLINALNDLHRPSPGVKDTLDLNGITTTVLARHEETIENTEIIVKKELAGELPGIRGIEPQISKAVDHLIVNAIEAMIQGGGTLLVQSTSNDGQVCLSISDTGTGISPEHRDHIFEPLFSTRKGSQNNGLGLSATYRIMQDHDGHICFNARPGGGSTFILSIPALSRSA